MKSYTYETFGNYEDHFTDEMIPVYQEFREQAEREYLYCDEMFKKCEALDTSLPQKTKSGKPLVNCDRGIMLTHKRYWETRRDLVKHHLSNEWIVEHGGYPYHYMVDG